MNGFARLRWGMSLRELRAAYPNARTTPTFEGRHPITKQRVVTGGDELIPAIVEAAPGLHINATIAFSASDELIRIELWPDLAPALPGPRSIDERLLTEGARRLALDLGLGPLTEIPAEQAWDVGGVAVTLTADDGFRFELSPSTPH